MLSTRSWACSRLSLEHGEELAGTASTATGYVLVEHGGPWGTKVLRDAEFRDPDGTTVPLGAHLDRALKPLGVTPLLVRRPGARHGIPTPATVMLVAVRADGGTGARRTVESVSEITRWDLPALLAELRAGAVPAGWQPLEQQLLVCTHARRDACCGELGRPVAAVLRDLDPQHTWEVSHLGGHRFASNVLVLPDGLVYGRLQPGDAGTLLAAHGAGRLLVDSLRGRTSLAQPVQAAEIALRKAVRNDAAAGLRLLGADVAEGRARTTWLDGERRWRVVVESRPSAGPPRPASCGADDGPPPPQHVVVELTEA